jgi:hypothetical protein
MRINRQGRTRIVIELKDVVIKIPNFLKNWQTFIRGLLSNMDEHDIWTFNSGKYEKGKSYLLCPILWSSWGGWVVVMKRAETVLTYDDYWRLDQDVLKEHEHFAGDDHGPNYGYLDGRLVKIDYAQIKY